MNINIQLKSRRNGVVFVADRVMHYHVAMLKAVEQRLSERAIAFSVLSARDADGAVGRVALSEKVVSSHEHFRLTERKVSTFQLRFQHGLLDHLEQLEPKVVISMCHSGTASEWAMLRWARRRCVRRVSWQCGYEYNPGRIKRLVLDRFVPLFDFHLCYHTNAQRFSVEHGAPKESTLVMHNTIDETRIVAGDKALAKAALVARHPKLLGKRLVLYVGAVLEEKRLDTVFQALAALRDPAVCFVLVGDGPYLATLRERYAARADWLSTGSIVQGVGEYFDAADVFVLPGTGGLAINEAMAHRTPVISGYADGSADDLVVDGETGFRLRTGDPAELADRIRQLFSDPERAADMGAQGEARIRGRLSFESFIERVVGVLVAQHELATRA